MNGRTAIITGGTGALGSVVVRDFVKNGIALAVPVHPGHQSPDPALYPGGTVYFHPADLQKEEEVGNFVRTALSSLGKIDFLVNIAGGYAGGKSVEETPVTEWDAMLDMNLKSVFLMCRAVLPLMRKERFGRIVNIAAMPVVRPAPRRAAYAVSKGGVATLTEAINEEVKGTGITINAIAPSILLTEGNRASMPGADTSAWVRPEEVAGLISYLCSVNAASVSGNVIRMFGGV